MNCCQCQGLERLFDQKTALDELASYRRKGPQKTTRILIEALQAKEDITGMTLLDIGGGVGAIQHKLLRSGLAGTVHVDASTGYLEAARQEAERQGHQDRVAFHHGNFVELAPDLGPADIVTLDRVICCYHDMPALVGLSAARAGKLYGLVFPRDTWWTKLGLTIINCGAWAMRQHYRFFAHPTVAVEALLSQHGLKRSFYRKTFLWQIAVYRRK